MKRYIILFNNGEIVQQAGLNATYLQLQNYGIIKYIIDTEKGTISSEDWKWKPITSYHDSSLIVDKDEIK